MSLVKISQGCKKADVSLETAADFLHFGYGLNDFHNCLQLHRYSVRFDIVPDSLDGVFLIHIDQFRLAVASLCLIEMGVGEDDNDVPFDDQPGRRPVEANLALLADDGVGGEAG